VLLVEHLRGIDWLLAQSRLPKRKQLCEPCPNPIGAEAHEPLKKQECATAALCTHSGVGVWLEQCTRRAQDSRCDIVRNSKVAMEEFANKRCERGAMAEQAA
jgi:hypothetical protein